MLPVLWLRFMPLKLKLSPIVILGPLAFTTVAPSQLLAYFFCSLAAWRYHPGWLRADVPPPTFDECMSDALLMVERYQLEVDSWTRSSSAS